MDDDYKIKPLNSMLPKTSLYVKSYDGKTKCMYFLINNDLSKKKKIKSYCDKVTYFHDKEMPKTGSNCTYFAVTLIDFVLEKDKNYCRQVL